MNLSCIGQQPYCVEETRIGPTVIRVSRMADGVFEVARINSDDRSLDTFRVEYLWLAMAHKDLLCKVARAANPVTTRGTLDRLCEYGFALSEFRHDLG